MTSQVVTAVLLVLGGVGILLNIPPARRDLAARLRRLDGDRRPAPGQWARAVAAGLVLLAIPALPLLLAVTVRPVAIGVLTAVAVLPMVAATVGELHAGLRRPAVPVRVPLLLDRQRLIVVALVERVIAPLPAPALRPGRPRTRSRPITLTSAGGGRRLLVVPAGHAPARMWELAEVYLGSRRRYRDVLALNHERTSPTGEKISEDSRIVAGWTLIMPRDAIGVGLVDLPGDPRLSWPGAAGEQPAPAVVAGAPQQAAEPVEAEPADAGASEDVLEVGPPPGPPDRPDPPGPPDGNLEHPPADLPWDLTHARMLAAGLLDRVAVRRIERDYDRPFGARPAPLDGPAAAAEAAAAIGADSAGAEFVDRVFRSVPPEKMPPVVTVRLRPDELELNLASDRSHLPAPFVAGRTGSRWTVSTDAVLAPASSSCAPTALVSLGHDTAGWVLADLAAARGVVGIAGDPPAARLVTMAMAFELATMRWSDDLNVTMVGFGVETGGMDARLRSVDRLDAVLDGNGCRADGERGSAPEFLVLATPPPTSGYEVLHRLVSRADQRIAGVLVTGGSRHDRWTFELEAGGIMRCPDLGVVVGAQALTPATCEAMARFVSAESAYLPMKRPTTEAARPAEPPRPVVRSPELVVRLFGSPRLDGPNGTVEADPVSVEIVAFLALHGVAGPRDIASAVFPRGTGEADLRVALKAVVDVLERAPSGRPGLLEYDDGALALTDDVQCDWHLFLAQCAAGRSHEALRLVHRGAAEEAAGHYRHARYSWLGRVPLARALPGYVADVAHSLAVDAVSEDRADVAVEAATAGLCVQPSNRLLMEDLETARSNSTGRALKPTSLL